MKRPNLRFTNPAWKAGMILILFSLLLAACAPSGAAAQGAYGAATPTGGAPTALVPVTGGTAVQVASNPKFGRILVTVSGMTLYTFAIDQVGVSRCESDSCVAFWPPYVASAQPTGAAEIADKLGLLTRPDSGSMQITYNEMPLYTFIADKNPGDVQGDGVNQFGGAWHVVVIGGSTGDAGSAATPAPQATAAVPSTGAAIQVATSPKLGSILVSANGMTLYNFSLDTPGVSNCPDAACTGYWPPYTVSGALTGAAEIQSQLSTITRSDGSKQAAYNGLPLYTYVGDSNPGDVQGDGVVDSGGTWHAVVVGATSGASSGSGGYGGYR